MNYRRKKRETLFPSDNTRLFLAPPWALTVVKLFLFVCFCLEMGIIGLMGLEGRLPNAGFFLGLGSLMMLFLAMQNFELAALRHEISTLRAELERDGEES